MIDTDDELTLEVVPPGNLDLTPYARLNPTAFVENQEYRLLHMRRDPILFALWYFSSKLRAQHSGVISLAPYHVDMAYDALQWTIKSPGEREIRSSWTVPRDGGKSTWMFDILPTWALAFNYSRFMLGITYADLYKDHLYTLKENFKRNKRLRRDFPALCTAERTTENRSASDTQSTYFAASGQVILGTSMKQAKLGKKIRDMRPDLIMLDDIEPEEARYGHDEREKILSSITQAILPMNTRARVAITGTTTKHGSIIHELVRAAEGEKHEGWIEEQNIKPHYYAPFITNGDGVRHSVWPQKWTTGFLESIEDTDDYAMNYLNKPKTSSDPYWRESMFIKTPLPGITERAVVMDFAVTSHGRSDYTGIAVGGYAPHSRKVCVEFCTAVRQNPAQLRAILKQLFTDNPTIDTLIIDNTQGKDTWHEIIGSVVPDHVEVIEAENIGSKKYRARRSSDFYIYKWVHHHPLAVQAAERQMCAFPDVRNDDMVDAVCYLTWHYLKDKPKPGEVRRPVLMR